MSEGPERDQCIEKVNRAMAKADYEAERAGNIQNVNDDLVEALQAQIEVNRRLMRDAGLNEQAIRDGTAQARAALAKAYAWR